MNRSAENKDSLIGSGRHLGAKWLVLLACVILMQATSVRAFIIKPTYDASVTSLPNAVLVEAAFGVAMDMFTNQFTNAITVNITVYWGITGPFTNGIDLGASQGQLVGSIVPLFAYPQLTNALRALRSSAADSNAVASLPASDPSGGGPWYVPRAEAKMFNFFIGNVLSPNDTNNDGAVGFASDVSYTFDPANRAVPGKYDFIGVAEHEISEVLGRSTLDLLGEYEPYDLFRFTNSGARNFDTFATNVYFSIDNGVTRLKPFYPDVYTGDIQDWASSTPEDSFDAYVSAGHVLVISTADITALDILGYNSPPIPSPRLTAVTLTNGTVRFSFTNTPGLSYTVLTTTNAALPISDWTVLGVPAEGPIGHFQFTDMQSATNGQRFYRVSSP